MVSYPSRRLRPAVLSLALAALTLSAPAVAAERFVRNAVAFAACVEGENQSPQQFLGFMIGLRDGKAVVATVKHGVVDAAESKPLGRLWIQACFGETVCQLETGLQYCRPDASGDGQERPARATILKLDKEVDLAFLAVPFPRGRGWTEDFAHPPALRRSFDLGWLLEPGAVWSLSERPDVEISPSDTAPELLSLSPNAEQNPMANQPTYVPPPRSTAVLGGQSGGPVMTARGILGMVLRRSTNKSEAILIDEIQRRAGQLWTGLEAECCSSRATRRRVGKEFFALYEIQFDDFTLPIETLRDDAGKPYYPSKDDKIEWTFSCERPGMADLACQEETFGRLIANLYPINLSKPSGKAVFKGTRSTGGEMYWQAPYLCDTYLDKFSELKCQLKLYVK